MMHTEKQRVNLSDIMNIMPTPDDLAWDHAMDISASVYKRLKSLGMSQKELAKAMGVSPGRISQIIRGEQGMSLKTLAKLEVALDMRLDSGFRYEEQPMIAAHTSSAPIPHQNKTETAWGKTEKPQCDFSLVIGGLAA